MSPGRHVRTRLYFTSESHVHSLLSIFRYGGLLDAEKDQQWKCAMDYLSAVSELNYMTQIVIMLYEDNNKDPSSEERFHVELHFSPGVRGCEDEDNVPMGFGFRPASAENQQKGTDVGSLEDLSLEEPDQAAPLSELISIQKRPPIVRNRKTGSVETLSETSRGSSYFLFPSCSRQPPEVKPSGIGCPCVGLFSAAILVGSCSTPNLQNHGSAHRVKLSRSLSYRDELLSMPAVKRFSVSYAKHPTNGFEGCSMVPSIYPLETLHNSLSLKQVDEFLTAVCENDRDSRANRALSAIFDSQSLPSVDTLIPQYVLSTSSSTTSATFLHPHPHCPPWCGSGPPSPSSLQLPCRFSFGDGTPLTPQSSEEMLSGHQESGHASSSAPLSSSLPPTTNLASLQPIAAARPHSKPSNQQETSSQLMDSHGLTHQPVTCPHHSVDLQYASSVTGGASSVAAQRGWL